MRKNGYSKLLYLLSLVPASERLRLRDYLHSPIFNKREEPRLLYDHLCATCLVEPILEIDDVAAAGAVWPGETYEDGRLQKLKSVLVQLVLGYLEFRHAERHSATGQVALIEELNELDDARLLPQMYPKVEAALRPTQDLDALRLRLTLQTTYMKHLHQHAPRSTENHLPETMHAWEQFSMGQNLQLAYVAANQGQIVGALQMPDWLLRAVEHISLDMVQDDAFLEIYYWLYHTRLPGAALQDLQRLKALVVSHTPHCTRAVAGDIYTGTLNNFNRQVQLAGVTMLQEVFELYQSMVAVYARSLGGRLHAAHFKNIVALGLRLGEREWVQAFLGKGAEILEMQGEDLNLALDYNHGIFHFSLGEYKLAARRLNAVIGNAKDVYYAANTRVYLLMCFFEMGDSLGMESLLNSFRMYLRRNEQVAEGRREVYLSFLKVFGKMLGTPTKDKIRLRKLRREIEGLKSSIGKEWLLQKCEALGG